MASALERQRTTAPPTRSSPASARIIPKTRRIRVVFPAPFSPRSAWRVPARTCSGGGIQRDRAPESLEDPASRKRGRRVDHNPVGAFDEHPRNAKALTTCLGERTNAQCFSRVVSGVDDNESFFLGVDGAPVRSFAYDECIDTELDSLTDRLGVRARTGADCPVLGTARCCHR